MDAALKRIRAIANSANEMDRKKLVITLRDALYSIESEDDTMHRILFLVSHLWCLTTTALHLKKRLGFDIGNPSIFKLRPSALASI